jgi:nicotinamide-nucleotide amidase
MTDILDRLGPLLLHRQLSLVTAESCTGGMIAARVTARSGASGMFERGFVTYSNESKEELLGVSREILENYGAVSRECAEAMVTGALNNSRADISLSVTGIAGPDGGSEAKPVGLVYIGWGLRNGSVGVARHDFRGDRGAIRFQSVEAALQHALDLVEGLN